MPSSAERAAEVPDVTPVQRDRNAGHQQRDAGRHDVEDAEALKSGGR